MIGCRTVVVALAAAGIAAASMGGCGSETPSVSVPSKESVTAISSRISVTPDATKPGVVVDPIASNTYFPTGAAPVDYGDRNYAVTAFDGTNYITAWVDTRLGNDLAMLSRISEDGTILEPAGIVLSALPPPREPLGLFDESSDKKRLAIAAGPKGAVVFWVERASYASDPMLRGAFVDPSGTVKAHYDIEQPALSVSIGTSSWELAESVIVAADAEGFRVFYYVTNPKEGVDFVSRRIVPDAPIGAVEPLLTEVTTNLENGTIGVRAASTPSAGLVTWTEYTNPGSVVRFATSKSSGVPQKISGGSGVYLLGAFATDDAFRVISVSDGNEARVNSVSENGAITSTSPGIGLTSTFPVVRQGPTKDEFFAAGWSSNGSEQCISSFTTAGTSKPCRTVPADNGVRNGAHFGSHGLAIGTSTYLDAVVFQNEPVPPALLSVLPADLSAYRAYPKVSQSASNERFPAVASDGEGYLVVWTDSRTAAPTASPMRSLLALRLDPTGAPVGDPFQLMAPVAAETPRSDVAELAAKVIFDGTKYVAAWVMGTQNTVRTLEVAILPKSGPLAIEKQLSMPITSYTWGDVGLGSDGKNRIVALSLLSDLGASIGAVRISIATDTFLDDSPKAISNLALSYRFMPSLAFDGTKTLVVWSELVGLSLAAYGTFLPQGEVTPVSAPFPIYDASRLAMGLRAASSGADGFLVSWSEPASGDRVADVRAKLVRSDGTTLGKDAAGKWVTNDRVSSIPISTGLWDEQSSDLAYANDGANYVFTWADNRSGRYELYASWISSKDGSVRDPGGVLLSGLDPFASNPAIAFPKDGKGVVVFDVFDDAPTVASFRIRSKQLESGRLLGTPCSLNEECGTRACSDGYCCESLCNAGCGTCSVTPGKCTSKAAATTCGRLSAFQCDGTSLECPRTCLTNEECASRRCVDSICQPPEVVCVDETHLDKGNGELVDCAPYRCVGGACRNPCASIDDCTGGLLCQFDGTCAAAPRIENVPGCSSAPPHRTSAYPFGIAGCMLALFVRFAQRRRAARLSRETVVR